MIDIAKVLKPQGLKGELKLECYSKDIDFWENLKQVEISDTLYKVESIRFYKTFGYIKLQGVDSIEQAELFRNKKLHTTRDSFENKENENEYLISDLEKCKVVDENNNLVGFIESIEHYGSADIINILIGGEMKSFPFLNAVIKKVDTNNNLVIVYSDKLKEVII